MSSLETFSRKVCSSLQDISFELVGELAHVQAGAQVIDLCAAPGGKALDVAERIFDGRSSRMFRSCGSP